MDPRGWPNPPAACFFALLLLYACALAHSGRIELKRDVKVTFLDITHEVKPDHENQYFAAVNDLEYDLGLRAGKEGGILVDLASQQSSHPDTRTVIAAAFDVTKSVGGGHPEKHTLIGYAIVAMNKGKMLRV